jgi:hypothetical protein
MAIRRARSRGTIEKNKEEGENDGGGGGEEEEA